MGLFAHEAEAGGLINAMCRREDALGPQGDLSIAGIARELNTLVHQFLAQAHAARRRIDVEQTELRRVMPFGVLDEEDVANMPTIHLCNPASFPHGVELLEEVCDD